jgi:hypothetical protein
MVAMFRKMLEDDRKRAGWSVGQAARRPPQAVVSRAAGSRAAGSDCGYGRCEKARRLLRGLPASVRATADYLMKTVAVVVAIAPPLVLVISARPAAVPGTKRPSTVTVTE